MLPRIGRRRPRRRRPWRPCAFERRRGRASRLTTYRCSWAVVNILGRATARQIIASGLFPSALLRVGTQRQLGSLLRQRPPEAMKTLFVGSRSFRVSHLTPHSRITWGPRIERFDYTGRRSGARLRRIVQDSGVGSEPRMCFCTVLIFLYNHNDAYCMLNMVSAKLQ